jgi:F-type H+-transporting ATPase subunit b
MADYNMTDQNMVEEVHQPDPGHASEGNPLLTLDPGMVIWTWIIFFLFLMVLHKFAWKPILQSLEEREESIKKSVEDAAEAKRSLETAMDEQEALINDGRLKASEAIAEVRGKAAAAAEEMRKRARKESEELIAGASKEIIEQQEKAVGDLRSEAMKFSLLVASKLLDINLDDDHNRELAKEYITRISI